MSTLDKATRAINKAEVVDHIPVPDYLIRYDFSRASETGPTKIQYLTDEATNDIDQIWSEGDVQTMVDISVATTYPSLDTDADGFPCIYFPGDGGLRNTVSLGAVDKTVFMVWKAPNVSGSYLYAAQFGAVSFGARNSIDADSPFIRGDTTDFYATNAFDDRRLISSFTNTHVGADDNDLEYWVGKTSQGTSLTAVDTGVTSTYVSFGTAGAGAQELPDTYIYEVIQYDRVLTTTERESVVDYLSSKWDVSNADNATDTISEKVSARVPTDYGMRWDASTPAGIGYLTDEATNDINSWADETGTLTLDTVSGTGTYPAYLNDSDGLPHVRFYGLDDRALYKAYDAAYDGATDMTVFLVTQSDSADQSTGNRYTVGGPGEFHGGHQSGSSNPPGTLYDGSFYNPTNDFDSRRVIFSHRNVYNGAADNDADIWCGKTNIHTATAKADANGVGYVTMGGYSTSTTWQCDCKIYEYVVFLRALSDAEHAAWVDYLSAKWQANNFDYATDSSTPTTNETWTTRFLDENGTAASGTPIRPSVRLLGEEGAPRVGDWPQDWYRRWDAANPLGGSGAVGYFTDEGTGDVDSWTDQSGAIALTDVGVVSVYPTFAEDADGFPGLYFDEDGALSSGPGPVVIAEDTDFTLFLVTQADINVADARKYMLVGPGDITLGSKGDSDADSFNIRSDSVDHFTTNSFDQRRAILGATSENQGVADNDTSLYCGTTSLGVGGATPWTYDETAIGGHPSGGANEARDCFIYELIVWDRVLAPGEISAVVDYLSAKWQVSNVDSASDVVSRTSTGAVDDAYPANMTFAGLTITRGFWFRSDVTGGMTFATGDARSGGTLSAWTDIWDNVTMDATTSGDSNVDYNPNVRGFPSVTGGTAASPKSLEANATITSVNSQTKLAWSVVGHEAGGDANSAPCGLIGNLWFPERDQGDDISRMALSGADINKTYGIPGSGSQGITINVWIVDATGVSPFTVRRFTQGYEHPADDTTVVGANFACSVGALSTSNFDSISNTYEMGMIGLGTTGAPPTDDEIFTFIKHLCNRYGVDYMPDLTPWIVGAEVNTTANYILFDMPYWYRADQQLVIDAGTITDWDLHPLVAAEHTSGDRNMNITDGDNALTKNANLLDRDGATMLAASSQHLRDDTGYVWTESTDFTAQTGISTFVVGRNNAKVNQAYFWEGASIMRQDTTTGQLQYRSSGVNVTKATDYNATWVIAIGTYDTTSGDHNLYVNNDAVANATDGVPGSPSTTRPNVGGSNAGSGFNTCDLLEVAEFKHVLTTTQRKNLQRYALYRYNDVSDFGF